MIDFEELLKKQFIKVQAVGGCGNKHTSGVNTGCNRVVICF